MLRMIFVSLIIIVGITFAVQGAFYALLFYLWNAYFRPEDWTYGGAIRSLDLSWVLGIYLVGITALSMPKLQINWRTALIWLFVADAALCSFLSQNPQWSWNSWVMFLKVALVGYLIVVLVTDRSRLRIAIMVIALSLGFECAKQGWAQLILNPGGKNDNPISFLGDNNGVALGTMMLVPLFGALAQTARTKHEAWLHRFFLIGVMMRGITTYSRGGFIALAIVAGSGFLRSQRKIRYALAVAAVAYLVISVMPPEFWDRMGSITASAEERDDSQRGRLHFWGVAWEMAKEQPVFGVGFDGFQPAYDRYNHDEEFAGPRAVHSVWFALLADMGFPGFTLFVVILVSSLFGLWRVSVNCKKDPDRRELAIYANALLTSLLAFAAAGSFLSTQYGEMFWHFTGLSIALGLIAGQAVPVAVSAKPLRAPVMATSRVS